MKSIIGLKKPEKDEIVRAFHPISQLLCLLSVSQESKLETFFVFRKRVMVRTRNGSYGGILQEILARPGRVSKEDLGLTQKVRFSPILTLQLLQLCLELLLKISKLLEKNGLLSESKPLFAVSW